MSQYKPYLNAARPSRISKMSMPKILSPITPYLRLANEMEKKEKVISYSCLFYAVEEGLRIDSKSKESVDFLTPKIDYLEKKKENLLQGEAADIINSNDVLSVYIENYACKLFDWANAKDQESKYTIALVKGFFTASLLFDVLTQFGPLSNEDSERRKYARWRSTHINKCIQEGEIPDAPESGIQQPSKEPEPQLSNETYPNSEKMANPAPKKDLHISSTQTPTESSMEYQSTDPRLCTKEAFNDISIATKNCNYAISALQFDKIDEAVSYLEKAKSRLTPYLKYTI
uniref:Vacuolar protein sorting-associated protein VTA1 homolog (Trinotate prediction) n=1 Tax=Myxobolus squamalis TaxID=59785 RepID=A0A6B2G031_MYXSQ